MADPLGLATSLVSGIVSRVAEVKTNEEECKLLASLAEKTLPLLETLHARDLSDPSVTNAIELVHEALEEAAKAVEDCSNATIFSALMHPENYSLPVKHAAEKLDHAISQVSLVSVGMTADIQSDVAALSEQLRHAKFNENAAMAHQTKALKDELDKAFHQNVQESDEVKKLIRELMKEHTSSNDVLRSELAKLHMNASEARIAKETQLEFELNQVIGVISESLGDDPEVPSVARDLKECLRCPLSKEVMKDPVVLKDSCMVYDRSSITEWLRQGHRYDPLTNVEMVSKDIVPNPTLRNACQILLEQVGTPSTTIIDDPHLENSGPYIELGLHEGRGKLMANSTIFYARQLLIVGPNGVLVGCTLYKGEDLDPEENKVEIGTGLWDSETQTIALEDTRFKYHGTIAFTNHGHQRGIKWSGKVSKVKDLDEEYEFLLKYFQPLIRYGIPTYPTILEMTGEVSTSSDNVKRVSKLVLALECDSNLDGWVTFESRDHEHQSAGHVLNGKWDENGTLQFSIYFSSDDTPLNIDSNPTNYEAYYRMVGSISHDERFSCPTFGGTITKSQNQGVIGKKALSTPLEGVKFVEYSLLREASTPWHLLHHLPLKLFHTSQNT